VEPLSSYHRRPKINSGNALLREQSIAAARSGTARAPPGMPDPRPGRTPEASVRNGRLTAASSRSAATDIKRGQHEESSALLTRSTISGWPRLFEGALAQARFDWVTGLVCR